MNKDLMRQLGFGKQVDKVEEGNCPFCGKVIHPNAKGEFRNEISRKEYRISGLCQACQDRVFKNPEEED